MQAQQHPKSRTSAGTFAKGFSGNPKGGCRLSHDFKLLARSHSEAALNKVISILNESADERSVLKAAEIILDRAYGKCTSDAVDAKEDLEIPEDIKRMSPEQLVKELKEMQ